MRFFTQKDQDTLNRLQHERDAAFESATRFAEANLRLASELERTAEVANRLSDEVIRLSQRSAPPLPEGEIEQPKSVTDNDVVLESPERAIRPEPPRPARVE
jgi:hypothetical protein